MERIVFRKILQKIKQDHQMLTFSPAKAFLEGIDAGSLHNAGKPHKPNPYVYSHHRYQWDRGFGYALYGHKVCSFDEAMPDK